MVHIKTKETLKVFCKWVNIKWNDCLLNSTLDGKTWWFTKNGKNFSGVNLDIIKEDKKLKYLSFLDTLKLKTLLKQNYLTWKYKIHINILSKLILSYFFTRPFKAQRYIYNNELKKIFKSFIKHQISLKELWNNIKSLNKTYFNTLINTNIIICDFKKNQNKRIPNHLE